MGPDGKTHVFGTNEPRDRETKECRNSVFLWLATYWLKVAIYWLKVVTFHLARKTPGENML